MRNFFHAISGKIEWRTTWWDALQTITVNFDACTLWQCTHPIFSWTLAGYTKGWKKKEKLTNFYNEANLLFKLRSLRGKMWKKELTASSILLGVKFNRIFTAKCHKATQYNSLPHSKIGCRKGKRAMGHDATSDAESNTRKHTSYSRIIHNSICAMFLFLLVISLLHKIIQLNSHVTAAVAVCVPRILEKCRW